MVLGSRYKDAAAQVARQHRAATQAMEKPEQSSLAGPVGTRHPQIRRDRRTICEPGMQDYVGGQPDILWFEIDVRGNALLNPSEQILEASVGCEC